MFSTEVKKLKFTKQRWHAKELDHGFLIHSYETIRAEAKEHESSIKLNSDALDALIRIQAKYEIQCRLCL
jgi:hypothetical protein